MIENNRLNRSSIKAFWRYLMYRCAKQPSTVISESLTHPLPSMLPRLFSNSSFQIWKSSKVVILTFSIFWSALIALVTSQANLLVASCTSASTGTPLCPCTRLSSLKPAALRIVAHYQLPTASLLHWRCAGSCLCPFCLSNCWLVLCSWAGDVLSDRHEQSSTLATLSPQLLVLLAP